MADVFLKSDVRSIFKDRKVLFMGDSVLRNLYQDFVYLVEKGTLTPNKLLKKKGVQIEDGDFPGDTLVEGGEMVPGRDYQEVREFQSTGRENIQATFNFLCRCYDLGRAHPKGEHVVEDFIDRYKEKKGAPDLIIILSALWDINRWGPSGIEFYKQNCKALLEKVQGTFPTDKTQLIWLCAPPVSVEVWGGLMVEGMEFQRRSMRFNVMEGNLMVALTTAAHGFDVLDLHYWMTHQIHKRMPDGIHWTQDAVRLQLNIILTHVCLSRDIKLPGRWGGERNRPLESARRIANAAISDLREHTEGPATKRRRVEETNSDDEEQDEEVGDGGIEDPLASCVRQVPSARGDDALASSTTFSQPPEEEQAYQSSESRDEIDDEEKEVEKSYFDAEAVAEQELGDLFYKDGEVSIVKAKIIGGVAISGKTVQVTHHPSVGSEAWVVQEEKKFVASDGTVFLRLVAKAGGRISVGTLLAQISC